MKVYVMVKSSMAILATTLVVHRPSFWLGLHSDSDTIDYTLNTPPMVCSPSPPCTHGRKEGMCLYLHKNIWGELIPQRLSQCASKTAYTLHLPSTIVWRSRGVGFIWASLLPSVDTRGPALSKSSDSSCDELSSRTL